MEPFLPMTVIQNDVEAARHRNDELMKLLVSVSTSLSTTRYIIEIINPFDIEGYVPFTFNEGEISTCIMDLG